MTSWLSDQIFLEKLAAIDFGSIAFKLMNPDVGEGLTLEQATRAIERYRRFLFLHYCYPNYSLVPSQEIDRVWHVHILDTAKYREDCNQLFGHFLDHYPYFGIGDDNAKQALEAAYTQTQALFHECFTDE
jgi:hypothetical protein